MTQIIPNNLFSSRLVRGALAIVTAILIIHTLIYFAYAAALIPFPFDYDQGEGHELYNAVLFSQGQCPYCANEAFPFYASNYPPVFHFLMTPFVWLFGPQYWYGRAIIFTGTLITAGAIAWAVNRNHQHRWAAFIAALCFLASNYIYHIGPLLRQHLLMVMFETLAVVIMANAFDISNIKHKRRKLFIGFLLLLLAGYTKQLAYSTCIAVGIWALLRNPRTAMIYSLGLITAAIAVFLIADISTDGNWTLNLISANTNPFTMEQYIGLLRQFIRLHWPLLILSSLYVLIELYTRRLSIFSVWFIISFASTVASGTWGAGDSYFATTIAASCILSGSFLATAIQTLSEKQKRLDTLSMILSLILVLIYSLTVIKLPTSGPIFGPIASALNISPAPGHRYPLYDAAGWTVGYAVTGHFPSQEDYDNGWHIVERIVNADKPAMTEDPGFMMQAGQVVVSNATQLNNLYQHDLYDPSQLVAMIENQDLSLIVLRARFYPPPVLEAIEENYHLDEVVPMNGFNYEIWIPN